MDDTEDDARYPPNPYPQSNRRPFPSSNYSSLHARNNSYPSQIPCAYPDDYVDEDEEEERNEADLAMNDADEEEEEDEASAGRGYLHTRNEVDEDEDDGEDSSESRGKRRRLDRYARGFELVPRSVTSPALKPLHCRTSSADWSEDSTFALLDAWGDRYLQNGRKSLRSDEWGEVAKKVSQGSKTPRSEAQCRNRLDTLKKKYKKEKAKYPDYSSSSSKWIYFQKMDELMSSPTPPPPATRQHPQLPCGIDAGEYVFASSRLYLNHSDGMDEMRDSPGDTASEGEGDEVDDESDGLPPRREKVGGSSESSFKMLADSIQKFGAIYEKIENSKRQQMAELERMRKEFHRDLELQKRQILDRAQAEIARLRQEDGEEEDEERTDEDGNGGGDDDDDIDVSAENMSG